MGNKIFKRKKKNKSVQNLTNDEIYNTSTKSDNQRYKLINDNFTSYNELEAALRKAGLESCQLIVGIDFTKSNTWQGGLPYFYYDNLHTIHSNIQNPYQQVLNVMCQSLAPFDDDQLIDAYGFGDKLTTNKAVFPLQTSNVNGYIAERPCEKLEGVLERYNAIVPYIQMSGPTSFAPIIYKAIDIVKTRKAYHILLIIADGAVDDMKDTIDAIVAASKYQLSIVCIGVGKGPWEKMNKMDDDIPERDFDNFQFVDFYKIMLQCENIPVEFAKHALMEIPDQYSYIKQQIEN